MTMALFPRRRAALALLGALLGPVGAAAEPVRYALDPSHSFVQFELLHFGTSTIRGRLGPARGVVVLDRAARSGEVSIELPMATVDTGFGPFNAHLRQPELLAVDAHPLAWFVARRLVFADAGGAEPDLTTLEGELTLRGVSTGLRLTATRFRCYLNPRLKREVCGGDFEGELRRSDFGIDYGLPFVGNAVHLRIAVEAVRTE